MNKAVKAIEKADRKVARKARAVSEKPAMKAIGQVSEIADQPPLYWLSAGVVAVGLATRNRKLARTGVRMFATEWLATALKSFVKHHIDRSRPFAMLENGYVAQRGGSDKKELSSFPSGHTAGAVGLARAVMREYPQAATAASVTAATIAAVQVPRAAHFMSDVAAGAAIGFVAEEAVDLLMPSPAPEPRPLSRRRARGASASECSLPQKRSSRSSRPTP